MKGMLHLVTSVKSHQQLRNYYEPLVQESVSIEHKVVLIEEAVYLVNSSSSDGQSSLQVDQAKKIDILVLSEDLEARGLIVPQSEIFNHSWSFLEIDYERLVGLTESHAVIRSVSLS